MLKIIQDLYELPRYLMGEGYDKSLKYINKIVPLDVISVPSGTKFGPWTVPDEWIIRDGWVKYNGEKIIDFLTIDHINGGGNKHLEAIRKVGGQSFYNWLITNNFPKGFRVLCWNCNHGKFINKGV